MDPGYPKLIHTELPGIGNRVDAAYENKGTYQSKDIFTVFLTGTILMLLFLLRSHVLFPWKHTDRIQLPTKKSSSHSAEQCLDGLQIKKKYI